MLLVPPNRMFHSSRRNLVMQFQTPKVELRTDTLDYYFLVRFPYI